MTVAIVNSNGMVIVEADTRNHERWYDALKVDEHVRIDSDTYKVIARSYVLMHASVSINGKEATKNDGERTTITVTKVRARRRVDHVISVRGKIALPRIA